MYVANTLKIVGVTIVRRAGYTDQVSFQLEGPTPFPEVGDPPCCSVVVRRGYAEKWLLGMGIDPSKAKLVEV